MPGDLYSKAAGTVTAGTLTSDIFDTARYEWLEVFASSGGGSAASTVTILLDAQDLDGNWYNGVGGSIAVAVSGATAQRIGRGAAGSAVLGVQGRVRLVTAGTMDFRINVVGF